MHRHQDCNQTVCANLFFPVLGCYSDCWGHPTSQQLNFPVSLMEPLCQIKQLLLTRRGGQSRSWKPFSLTAKTRLTGNAACYSRSHSNIVVPPEPGERGGGCPSPVAHLNHCETHHLYTGKTNPQLFFPLLWKLHVSWILGSVHGFHQPRCLQRRL